MTTGMSPRRALETYCDAFRRRAIEEFDGLFADNAVFDLPLNDGRVTGCEGILRSLRAAIVGLQDIEISLDHVIESSGAVLAEGRFQANQVGVPPEANGTPCPLHFKFVVVAEVANGRIVRWSEYFDTKPLIPSRRARLYPIHRRSPYWEGSVKAGVMDFMVYNHMYFPLIYRHSPAEEYIALTERVTLWDVGCERQTELRGVDALKLAQYLTTRDLSTMSTGDCKYTLVCDPEGQIICDPVALRPWDDLIWLSHGDVDLTLWARGIAVAGGFDVAVREPDVAPLQIQGPRSLDVLQDLVRGPLAGLGSYKCMATTVAGIPAVVSRTGWSGGRGYEVFPLSTDRAMELWDSIVKAGHPHGLMVTGPNINRAVERGVTDTAYYSNSGMNPFEADQARLVDFEKGEFVGRAALSAAAREPIRRKTVGLLIEGEIPLLEWYWPITGDDRATIGEVRWAAHSFALGRSVAIAILDGAIQMGDTVRVHHPLGTPLATVTKLPFVARNQGQ
jgi:glycine cleavage system aminomethyltransferase T/limonene-1,2-epoxide hydrolase